MLGKTLASQFHCTILINEMDKEKNMGKKNSYFKNWIDCFRNIAVLSLCKFHIKLSFFPLFHVTFNFLFFIFSGILKEFKQVADWDLVPILNEGLQNYGRTILEKKASHDKL